MCGITGYAGFDDRDLLGRMCAKLYHRGPDEDGFYFDHGVGLAMRRLSIIDLKTGTQPISNETGDVHVVFNGEIYNYQDLRRDLLARGHTLKTESDTETIVHLYEDHGLDFVQHLRGMFAIAIWDQRLRRLVLARDRIGEKPLFYSQVDGRLLFGSEIKAILPGLGRRTVNPTAVSRFLTMGYVPAPATFFSEISKLPPGHMLVRDATGTEIRQYWSLQMRPFLDISYPDAVERLEAELRDSVRLCLKSDVEVGAFLSGGVDSSTVVALMAQSESRIQTFSVGYRGEAEGFNELSYASRVASHLGTKHHELILDAQSSIDLLPKIIWHYDEPHGEPTSVLVYLLCEFVRKTVKVALSGTGGDELFLGYPRHVGIRYLQYYRMLPGWLRRQVIERVLAGLPESTTGGRLGKRINRFIAGAGSSTGEAYLTWVSLFHPDVRASLLSRQVLDGNEDPMGDAFLRQHLLSERAARDPYESVTGLDIGGYLPEYQLAYMDRMSMAHSLEVRSPLCDYRLAEYATRLPTTYRLKGTRTKRILKDVAARWVPRSITERRKVGFDSPIGQWFKTEIRGFLDVFLSREQVARSGLLDPDSVTRIIGEHCAGRRDYSLQLWSILALEAWYRMYMDEGVADPSSVRIGDLRGGSGASPGAQIVLR